MFISISDKKILNFRRWISVFSLLAGIEHWFELTVSDVAAMTFVPASV